MEGNKMKKTVNKIFLAIFIIGLTVFLSGTAVADSEVSISGVINEDGQLVDNEGRIYDIVENEEGHEVMEMVGHKVSLKGTMTESDGAKIIAVTDFKLLED